MNNYYPFGLMWDNPEGMPNATYQGKEFQTNTFSDGSELALYDFGARMYDPVLGRWHCADPMYQFDSPYNAMANNPVVNIDPDGMWSIPWGNIMSSIGGYIAAIKETATQLVGYADFVNGDTQAVYSSSASNPLSNLGQSLQVVGTLLQAWQDGKMIKDAAGEMGAGMQANTSTTNYSYYFDRYGTFLRKVPKENGDAVFVAENVSANFDDLSFTGYRGDFVKDYISVVCGEAASRDDAAGIGTVIQNRFDTQDSPQRSAQWWTSLGGANQYDAISKTAPGNGFPDIQALSLDVILTSSPAAYTERIGGALTALSNASRAEINVWLDNPYFWEGKGSYKKENYFFDNVAAGIYQLASQAGGSYFFHYNSKRTIDFNRGWP